MKTFEITQQAFLEYSNKISKSEEFDMSKFVNKRPDSVLENGIGHVFVTGCLLSNSSPIDREMGNTDYNQIVNDVEILIENGALGIILHLNSGGGESLGSLECASYIQNLEIPSIALVDSAICCSACYKIASACSYIVASPSSIVGNIGSIMVIADTSIMNKSVGLSYNAFYNQGAVLKSIGHSDTLSNVQKSFLQESINESGKQFQDFVLSNRKIDTICFQAGWYCGEKALALGLIDYIGDEQFAENMLQVLTGSVIEDESLPEK